MNCDWQKGFRFIDTSTGTERMRKSNQNVDNKHKNKELGLYNWNYHKKLFAYRCHTVDFPSSISSSRCRLEPHLNIQFRFFYAMTSNEKEQKTLWAIESFISAKWRNESKPARKAYNDCLLSYFIDSQFNFIYCYVYPHCRLQFLQMKNSFENILSMRWVMDNIIWSHLWIFFWIWEA